MSLSSDPKVQAVMAAYQARADAERSAFDDPNRRRDELLLPVGPDTGALLAALVKGTQARTILEIGTSYGYSTVWLAEAARATGGKVISLELHARKVDYAQEQLAKAGLADHVEFRIGDALKTLEALPGPFEIVLLDLWKDLYVRCFDLFYPKLAPGAIIVADNMLFPETARHDANLYRARARAAAGISSVLLPIGHGIEVSRFR
ncbi:MAG TPA: class I SAM-dependent methyltransferase [Gammaproteobacteria bacterium]|nr:class I SAM-dependent methyltransferase [Gammaproteobacteria bacterium]